MGARRSRARRRRVRQSRGHAMTASLTQSRTGAQVLDLAHAPDVALLDRVLTESGARPSRRLRVRCPERSISKVLSWEPYSSAFCAIRPTLDTEPIVVGSKAPFALQKSMTAWIDAGVARVRDYALRVLQLAVGVPHAASRRGCMAGMEASMMTSLGTWRFVMPLSESTIARPLGPPRSVGLDVRLDLGARRSSGSSRSSARRRRSRCSRSTPASSKSRRRAWRRRLSKKTFEQRGRR